MGGRLLMRRDYSVFSDFARTTFTNKYAHDLKTTEGKEDWPRIARRTAKSVLSAVDAPPEMVDRVAHLIRLRKWMPGGRYLYAAGRQFHQVNNCMLFKAEDSREGWSELMYKATMSLMSGAGIGGVYSWVREEFRRIRKTGGFATGPLALIKMANESGRYIMQGGSRRSAIWAGLHWWHPDIHKFIHSKDWSPAVRALKEADFSFPAALDMTNISVLLDDGFFEAIENMKHPKHAQAHAVYWDAVEQMLKTGEPGFSVDIAENAGECLRNACTEVTSSDDSDICNLGSINLARIESLEEMREVTDLSVAFLLAGTVYSLVPFPAVDRVRERNRRLGLGLMGLHEWLLVNGKQYGPDPDLDKYLEVYRDVSDKAAVKWAKKWDLSVPVKKRAIAPTGTIGIVAETTTGIEPMYCAAFKRRYLDGQKWRYQYVVESVAKRMVEDHGVDPNTIEDAMTLAGDVERRLQFQAHVQKYVDHGISSTINLPAWGSEFNNKETVQKLGSLFLKYLPDLRGLTCYPDGARGGQPLTPVKYATAMKHLGEVFEESVDVCDVTGRGGTCGS
jgi:ribonucleoside-diphosphate reductase alpha chain